MSNFKAMRQREKIRKLRGRKGFHGYPVATVALYGPDDQRASKMVASVMRNESGDIEAMEKWYSDTDDLRKDRATKAAMLAFCAQNGVKSIVMADRIIGCPHEEGIDYPEGEACPECPFWKHRDRFTDELLQ